MTFSLNKIPSAVRRRRSRGRATSDKIHSQKIRTLKDALKSEREREKKKAAELSNKQNNFSDSLLYSHPNCYVHKWDKNALPPSRVRFEIIVDIVKVLAAILEERKQALKWDKMRRKKCVINEKLFYKKRSSGKKKLFSFISAVSYSSGSWKKKKLHSLA